jgi:glycolate oxidase iron-sulfur subunit
MKTALKENFKDTELGKEADSILRSCVHCGFCNATCPTYQLLGDELDGPRGRIYQIKQALEGNEVTKETQLHLDRCLYCLACETTCPSGVRYSHLLEIGRKWVEQRVNRSWDDKLKRYSLRTILPNFAKIPTRSISASKSKHSRTMLILDGCVQPVLEPNINAAAAKVFDQLGINLHKIEGCCGAINQHMTATEAAAEQMRHNIDNWLPLIEEMNAEAIVITASGCGTMLKEYGYYLRDDANYAEKAQKITNMTRDISEIIAECDLSSYSNIGKQRTIAFHAPCSLQHAQKITGVVEPILESIGFKLSMVEDAHLCCGSAGTYSILQKSISKSLLDNKIKALEKGKPELIATANIGCLKHLASESSVPVVHWIELLVEHE